MSAKNGIPRNEKGFHKGKMPFFIYSTNKNLFGIVCPRGSPKSPINPLFM